MTGLGNTFQIGTEYPPLLNQSANTIRVLQKEDADYVLAMMLDFYMSPAVIHKPDIETLKRNIEACLSENQPGNPEDAYV